MKPFAVPVSLRLLVALPLFLCCLPSSGQRLAVKTNALYWLSSTPNVGMEVTLSRHFSLLASFGYNAWKFGGERSLKHTALTPEVRYWFSKPMERHFLGLYLQASSFNIRNIPLFRKDDLAFRGEFQGGGLSYGYQWALGKRFGIEASVGFGYLLLSYGKFQVAECCAERISNHKRDYFGPTKVALNLIYLIQ